MSRSVWNTRTKQVLLWGIFLLLLGTVCFTVYTTYQLKKMTNSWYQPLNDTATDLPAVEKQPNPAEMISHTSILSPNEVYKQSVPMKPFTLLLIGVDSREGEKARSDTMILAAVHPQKQKAYLFSIPRDSFMEIPSRGYDKVNHAMAFGGPSLVKKSLEPFFGIKIDRYVTIDFDGFRKIIDELGGVEVQVKKRMKYKDPTDNTDIDLYPGTQTLSGKQALDYARYRKSDIGPEDSDYERIVRQQEIIKALANHGDTMHAFFKAFKLFDIVGNHVKTDLTEQEIASLLLTYYDPKQNHLETDALKGSAERIWHHGARGWYYLVSKKERQRIHEQMKRELTYAE